MLEHDLKEPLNKLTDLAKEHWPDDKWKLLNNFAIKVLDFEVQRFHKVDEKATKFITAISVVITIFLALFKWVVDESDVVFSIYIYVIFVITFSSLCTSWYFFFQALRLMPAKSLDLNDNLIKLFNENNIASLRVSIYKSCKDAVEHRRRITENKTTLLSRGFKVTSFTGLMLLTLIAAVTIEKSVNHHSESLNNLLTQKAMEISMSNEKEDKKENGNQPNLDIESSGVHVAMEDYKSEIPEKNKSLNESEGE